MSRRPSSAAAPAFFNRRQTTVLLEEPATAPRKSLVSPVGKRQSTTGSDQLSSFLGERKSSTFVPDDQQRTPLPPKREAQLHHFSPTVAKYRPSTASRSIAVGDYKQLHKVRDQHDNRKLANENHIEDATATTMGVLSCVQQLDFDIMARPKMLQEAETAVQHKGVRFTPRSEASAPLTSDDEDEPHQHWHRRSPREVMERKTDIFEAHLARKLEAHLRGEERRRLAAEVRISRPLIEKQLQFVMLWLKIIYTVQPITMMSEALRQHRARRVLRTLFSVQVIRCVKRLREKKIRQAWMKERFEQMQRPSIEALVKAVPLLNHLPFSKQAELQQELRPCCFRAKEYMTFSSIKAQSLLKNSGTGILTTNSSSGNLKETLSGAQRREDNTPHSTGRSNSPLLKNDSTLDQFETASTTTSKKDTASTKGGKEFGNQMMIFIAKGSAVSHSVLAQQGLGGTQTEAKITEIFLEGHAIGLEALIGADVKRHVTIARTDVDGWMIPLQRIHETIEGTGGSVAEQLLALAIQRRKESMRLQPMSVESLRASSPLLSGWSDKGAANLIQLLTPVVLQRGDEFKLKGVYFVIRGRLEVSTQSQGTQVTRQGGRTTVVNANNVTYVKGGQCCGAQEVYMGSHFDEGGMGGFAKPPQKNVRVVSETLDAWHAKKADFMEIAAHENVESLLPLFEAVMLGPNRMQPQGATTSGGFTLTSQASGAGLTATHSSQNNLASSRSSRAPTTITTPRRR